MPASQVFTLTNATTTPFDWAIVNPASWLSVSPASGTLGPSTPARWVTVALSPAAQNLAAGVYQATLTLTNLTTGIAQNVQVSLLVGQNVVQNGGFETGSFSGWTLQGIAGDNHAAGALTSPAHPELVHSGAFGALLGEVGALGCLSQSLATTPGQLYLLSFWLASPYYTGSDSPNEFLVEWSPATNTVRTLFDQVDMAPFAWTNLQFVVSAWNTNAVLTFGARNDPWAFGLDDVSVVPIAAPRFQGATLDAASFAFTLTTTPGLAYQLQSSTNLAGGVWTALGTVFTASNTTVVLADAERPAAQRFYRAVLSP